MVSQELVKLQNLTMQALVSGCHHGADMVEKKPLECVAERRLALRNYNPNIWINATVGTWPSPFWTRYADSIWRQGQDTGFAGVGNNREQWITYRDQFTHERISKRGPYADQRIKTLTTRTTASKTIKVKPFEVLVFEVK